MWIGTALGLVFVLTILSQAVLNAIDQRTKHVFRDLPSMSDEDYLLVPYDARMELEGKYRTNSGCVDWAAVEEAVRRDYPHVLGQYARHFHGQR